jgi:multidrug efflux system membrane fusion protein
MTSRDGQTRDCARNSECFSVPCSPAKPTTQSSATVRITRHYRQLLFHLSWAILILSVLAISCGRKEDASARGKRGGNSAPRFPVEVAPVEMRDAEFTVNAVGSVDAFEIVQVTAQVPGAVQKVRFKEGDVVSAGDSLAEIQTDRYRLAVQAAQAAFEKAKAARREIRAGLERRIDIEKKNPGFLSKEELDDWQTRALSADADSSKAAADLELAQLNLRDAYVPAPVAGTIQIRQVQTGQYVQSGTVLAKIVRRDPLLLRFSVPEQDAARIHKGMKATFHVRGSSDAYTAHVTAVSEAADSLTRLVPVTAEITDPQRHSLRPGSFAEVTVHLGERANYPIIPQTAIRPSERGFLAYIVQDSTAFERTLQLGARTPDGFVEVRSGIHEGDQIVVRGAEALRDSVTVRIVQRDPSSDTLVNGIPE